MPKITDLPPGVQDAIWTLYHMAQQSLDHGSYHPDDTDGPESWNEAYNALRVIDIQTGFYSEFNWPTWSWEDETL